MPRICFVSSTGERLLCDAEEGETLLDVALNHLIPGIDGDCGGNVACGTCHIYVDAAWTGHLGPPVEGAEIDMLGNVENVRPNSRLACQIHLSEDFDGLVVEVPAGQH